MKLTIFIMTVFLLQLSAATKAQITLNESQASLQDVLKNVSKQSGYDFIYSVPDFENTRPVNIKLENVSLEDALQLLFVNQPLEYAISDKTVMVKKKPSIIKSKLELFLEGPVRIRGKITDSLGNPLGGATISILKSTKNKTTVPAVAVPAGVTATAGVAAIIVGSSGEFEIVAEEGDRVIISYVGYESFSFTAKRDMSYQYITLHSLTAELSGVVVNTGYQTLSKERATGSFSKPDMRVFANRSSTTDVIGRLEGLIPGLTVSQDLNINMATRATTRKALIRGSSSVNLMTDPLYVVNGVIVSDFGTINVDDIQDITILKDAAAAAIWGSKASNGVVVVVTKSGHKNQKVKVNYQGFINFQGKPNFDYMRYLSSSQYIQAARETFDPVTNPYSSLYSSFIAPHEQILYNQDKGLISAAQANASLDSLSRINNKQQILDLWYRNAYTTNHSVSASGGSNTYSFYGSLGYANTHSSNIGETNNSYRIDLNQSFNPSDRFSFSLSTSLSDAISSGKHPVTVGPDFIPYQLFKDANGNNVNMPYIYGMSPEQRANYQALSGVDLNTFSPLDELNYGHSHGNYISLNLVANTTIKLWKGLSYLGTYGYVTSPGENTGYDDHKLYSMRKQLVSLTIPGVNGSAPEYLIPATGGNFRSSNNIQRSWTLRNQLVYTYSGRNGNDLINLQGGQEARENFSRNTTTNLLGYDEDLQSYPLLDYLALSQGIPGTVTGYGYFGSQQYQIDENLNRYNSYFALASYTLNHKYSIDASWRVDHSNLFGSDVSAQNKPVYSFGAKWNLAKESFLQPVSWVNDLSLRVTYGITGNSPYVGAASTFDVLYDPSSSSFSSPSIAGKSYTVSQYANRKLSWEATHTTNIGVDFSILDNRLGGTVEYYHKNTTDLIGRVPVDPFTGETSATSNIGNLTNNGINIGLNSINIRSTDFTWSTYVAFAVNSNKLVSYSAPQSYMSSASYRMSTSYVVGYNVSPLFAYRYAGLDNVGDPQIKLADGTITKDPQKPTADDLVYEGSTIPKISGGISNTFRYKQFELSANMIYNLGAVMRRDVNQFYGGQRLTGNPQSFSGNISADFANRWKKPGDENITDIPAFVQDGYYNYSQRNTAYYTMADINVVSASYLKLREVSLAYNLAPQLAQWLRIESATLRLQVSNILLWKANKYGLDPEFQYFQYGSRGTPTGQHSITLGINVNF